MVAQTRNLEHSRLFRHGDDHSGSLICIELLAAALVAWAASSGALSLAAGISEEIHDDERITGERRRRPVGKQYGFKSGVVLRSSLVIRVEYAMAIEKPVHRRRDAHAVL